MGLWNKIKPERKYQPRANIEGTAAGELRIICSAFSAVYSL